MFNGRQVRDHGICGPKNVGLFEKTYKQIYAIVNPKKSLISMYKSRVKLKNTLKKSRFYKLINCSERGGCCKKAY